jgi:hypothetical protein
MTFTAEPVEIANSTTSGDQFQPSVAAFAGGGYVLVWTSGTGASSAVYSQVYDANGNKVGGETLLFQASSAFGVQAGGVAALPDGSFVVSLGTGHQEQGLVYDDVYAVRVNADGQVGTPFLVGTLANSSDVTTTAGEVYAGPDGGFYVSMVHEMSPRPVSSFSSTLQRYDADGSPVGPAFLGVVGFPNTSITVLPDGRIATASDAFGGHSGPFVGWGLLTADGQPIEGAVGTVSSPFSHDVNPSITALQDGRSVLVWSHLSSDPSPPVPDPNPLTPGVYALVLDENGQAVGTPSLLDVPQAPDIIALPGGGFLAYWAQDDGNGNDAYSAREFSASAQPVGAAFSIAAPEATQPNVQFKLLPDVAVLANGGFVVAFDAAGTGQDVYLQAFSVAQGQTIEGGNGKGDLQGTAGADTLRGDNGKDTLFGDLGDDILNGGNGVDTALFSGNRSQYVVTVTESGYIVTGLEGTDTLIDIERIQFADTNLALDVNTEGQVSVIGTMPFVA